MITLPDNGQLIGYGRTSTAEQIAGLEAQIRDLKALGCVKIYSEQISSVATRDQLKAALDYVREGDVLVVTKPDRLARSTQELLNIEAELTGKKVGLVVLSMGGALLDTRNPTSKLMLTMLAAVATWEREIMLDRQREGIAKAKAEGKYKGRVATVATSKGDAARKLRGEGHTPTEIARMLGISRMSAYRFTQCAVATA